MLQVLTKDGRKVNQADITVRWPLAWFTDGPPQDDHSYSAELWRRTPHLWRTNKNKGADSP